MQPHQFFELKTPRDLLRKLEREYDRWKADPLNVDLAWDFFVTAEHLVDWVYYQDMPTTGKPRPDLLDGKDRQSFKQTYPLTRICSHLANGGKHFHLYDPNLTSVAGTRQQEGWIDPGWIDPGWVQFDALVVDLTPNEQWALSLADPVVEALPFAADVLAFWQARLP
jgi:hypothetical protein